MSQNGSPTPFRQSAVPIVGQPFTLKNWFLTVQIVCNCPGKEPVLLVGNGIGQCPACQRRYQFHGLQVDKASGNISFAVGLVANESAAVVGES